jgi:NAD(P)H-dependent nitrite reductase small subunit
MSDYTTVAQVGEIPEGRGAAFEVAGRMIAVFNDAGQYYAIDDCCPHMGASLAEGILEQGVVACPWHAWRFRVCDGTWCDNRRIQIDRFEVRVVDGAIQVRVPA